MVRSFDNTQSETIQFSTPLTLIVGHNGSGKTTIIECLKYATTGDLPPNSKGGAFIHDPKLCGEKEVLAQVKLSFKSTSGAKLVATRSLQLTVKKTTRQQKTLEGQLLMVRNGERTSISSRVAELDQMMPQYLGVSKAVLDSVIFCHQDESLWPMSEPSVLKKKFDEIFEALKYTKAIDNIKALRKKQNEELAKFKLIEQHSKEDKDKADKAEKKANALSQQIEQLRDETKLLHTQAQDAGDHAQAAWDHVAVFAEVVQSLKTAQDRKAWFEKQQQDLAQDLQERPESDEWIQNELDRYVDRIIDQEKRKTSLRDEYDATDREIQKHRKSQDGMRIEEGRHLQNKATHEQRTQSRATEIKASARLHNIRGFDSELDDMQVSEFVDKVARLFNDQTSEMERLRKQHDGKLQNIQAILDGLIAQRSAYDAGKKTAASQIAVNDKKLAALHAELDDISTDEGGRAIREARLDEVQAKLKQAKKGASTASWDGKISTAVSDSRALENRRAALHQDLIQGTKLAKGLARLDYLKKEAQDRQRSLQTMRGAHGGRLGQVVGADWQPSSVEQSYQKALEVAKREASNVEQQREGVSRELQQVEFQLKIARSGIQKKKTEVALCTTALVEAIRADPEDYPESLAIIQSDRDTRRHDVDAFEILKKWYGQCIDVAKAEVPACRLCSRAFEKERDTRDFIRKCEKQLSKAALEALQKELKGLEQELKTAKQAGPSYDTWVRLSTTEIPSLTAEISGLEQRRDGLLRRIQDDDRSLMDKEEHRREVETLSKPVANIHRYQAELDTLQQQIGELSSEQNDSGTARTMDEIQEEIQLIDDECGHARAKVDKLQAQERQTRTEINDLELELGKARTALMTANHELEKKARTLHDMEDWKKVNREQRDILAELESQLQQLSPKFAEEETRQEDLRHRAATKAKEMEDESRGLRNTLQVLERSNREIEDYIQNGGLAKLSRCQHDIQRFEDLITQLQSQLRHTTVEINTINKELDNHGETKRILKDNLKYRQTRQELETVQGQIERLKAQNADADQQHYRDDAEKWQRNHKLLTTEETSKMGTMKAKDDLLMQLLTDWNTDYKDAAAKFKRAHIEVETTKAAVEDLGRYGGALDNAIMKYHSLKMEEINRCVEELWKKTYQGTDVDTILIRSDNETARGNRSYNYRVCMVKQDAEMDMRGRCSAGQRVLASIIIRLALAECFGVNCGVIALDEPTTNLDAGNIRALAESLHEIIRQRMQQRNFQLIVITHDEEFLRYMKCADFCETYYRVARNERQKSIIERQSIAEVL